MEYIINKPINVNKLHVELEALFPSFVGVIQTPDFTKTVFDGSLVGAEIVAYNDAINAHDPTELTYRLYDYVADTLDASVFPGHIDYKTGLTTRLHPVHELAKGELQKTVYYAVTDGVTFSIPVLQVTFVWHRDANGFIMRRDSEITYYMNDGSLSVETKQMQKYYNEQESIDEGRRRRRNIVNDINLTVVGLMQMTINDKTDDEILQMGRDWYATNKDDIDNFVETSEQTIRSKILVDVTWWMSNVVPNTGGLTIREIVYSKSEV